MPFVQKSHHFVAILTTIIVQVVVKCFMIFRVTNPIQTCIFFSFLLLLSLLIRSCRSLIRGSAQPVGQRVREIFNTIKIKADTKIKQGQQLSRLPPNCHILKLWSSAKFYQTDHVLHRCRCYCHHFCCQVNQYGLDPIQEVPKAALVVNHAALNVHQNHNHRALLFSCEEDFSLSELSGFDSQLFEIDNVSLQDLLQEQLAVVNSASTNVHVLPPCVVCDGDAREPMRTPLDSSQQ